MVFQIPFHFHNISQVIAGNSLRIVLTVLCYQLWGAGILENTWHIALGYVQIILALLIFLAIGKLFRAAEDDKDRTEVKA